MGRYYDDSMREHVRALVRQHRPNAIVADFITPCAWEVADEFGIPVIINVPGSLGMLGNVTWSFILSYCYKTYRASGKEEAGNMWCLFKAYHDVLYSRPCLFNTFFGLEPPQSVLPNIILTGTTAPRPADNVQHTSH